MEKFLLVAAGGATGAMARYWVGTHAGRLFGPGWPWGTLIVNVVGGLLMGVLVGVLARHSAPEGWRLLLGVGVLGGFTTFSSFSLDVVTMIERGAPGLALGYILVSVIGSIAALFAGLSAVRAVA